MEKNSCTGSAADARERGTSDVLLGAQRARHEVAHRLVDRRALEQDAVHGVHDRHLDAGTLGERTRARGVQHALRDGLASRECLLERAAAADLLAERAVAAEEAGA